MFILVPNYDKAFNDELVKEIEGAPTTDVWTRAVRDYHLMRKAVQACKRAT